MSKALLKSTSVVAAMTLLSRVLGFVRDMLVAQLFGASAAVDAFYVAFKIPNFMRALFAEGCFSQAFVPVLSEYRTKRSPEEVKIFISRISANLGCFLLVLTALAMLAAPLLVMVFAPGFKPGMPRFDLTASMLRITFPYLMLISLTALVGSVLNSYGKFAIPAFTPVWLNVCMIVAACWLAPHFAEPVMALAWGVFFAGIVQFLFQLPFLYRLGFLTLPRINWQDNGVKRVLKLMVPALFGASVGQISLLLNTIFASFLPIGSVTWLYYSDRLAYFPLGVFGVALSTVVLPHLARHHAAESSAAYARTLTWGIRCNLLIGIPASLVLALLAGPMILTLFHYGRFNLHDVLMTKRSVIAYALGLQAFMLVKLLSSAFYARQDVRTPVMIGIISVGFNMLCNALLVFPLAHAGLALAASLAACLNASLLWWGLRRKGFYHGDNTGTSWLRFGRQLLFANLIMSGFLYYTSGSLQQWQLETGLERAEHLFLLMSAAGIIYLFSLFLAGMRWRDLKIQSSM